VPKRRPIPVLKSPYMGIINIDLQLACRGCRGCHERDEGLGAQERPIPVLKSPYMREKETCGLRAEGAGGATREMRDWVPLDCLANVLY